MAILTSHAKPRKNHQTIRLISSHHSVPPIPKVSPGWLKFLAWTTAWVILGLNVYLVVLTLRGWL